MTMIQHRYRLTFLTPAFLGNAEQTGQWRTPPIKALLRQWWRVVYASEQGHSVNVAAMRATEASLFGAASDGASQSNRSRLRLRLGSWDKGRMTNWSGVDSQRIVHPEVGGKDGRPVPIGAQLYLGYGPLTINGGQTSLKIGAAIQAGDSAELSLAFPDDEEATRLKRALWLMHQYGTLGGRSRNGWGSFILQPAEPTTPAFEAALDEELTMPLGSALSQDWPQAIGTNAQGPLIWQTEAVPDWKAAMLRLAKIKIEFRRQFVFTTGQNAPRPEDRHWLSYPVTNHSVREWGGNTRLPNSLRFKVRPDTDGQLRGLVFHMPCLPPPAFKPDRRVVESIWQRVHAHLDASAGIERIAA